MITIKFFSSAGEEVVIEGEQERAVRAQEGVLLLINLCITYGLDKQVRTLHFY